MATHANFEADLKAKLKDVSSGKSAGPSEVHGSTCRSGAKPPLQWNQAAHAVPAVPGTMKMVADHHKHRGLRRIITREQGCVLEMLGHAVDYLNDCYVQEGAENEIIDFSGPTMEAIQILISTQRQVLHSLPLSEPLTRRIWNTLLRRKSQSKSSTVVPLTSSR